MPREALTQKIDATATALLGLTGITADPVQSREHILIAQLLLHAWNEGRDLDLPGLIAQIQKPPHPHRRRLQPGDVLPGQGPAQVRLDAQQRAGRAELLDLDDRRAARPGRACSTAAASRSS